LSHGQDGIGWWTFQQMRASLISRKVIKSTPKRGQSRTAAAGKKNLRELGGGEAAVED